jgi:cytochrome P450
MLPNYYSANMDESVWPNPEEFRPERFLSSSGEVINAEKIMTFGIGIRISWSLIVNGNTI